MSVNSVLLSLIRMLVVDLLNNRCLILRNLSLYIIWWSKSKLLNLVICYRNIRNCMKHRLITVNNISTLYSNVNLIFEKKTHFISSFKKYKF